MRRVRKLLDAGGHEKARRPATRGKNSSRTMGLKQKR
jgi:hypothetical protein